MLTPEQRADRRWARQEAREADLRRRLESIFTERDQTVAIGRVLGQLFTSGQARAIAHALREEARRRDAQRREQTRSTEERERRQRAAEGRERSRRSAEEFWRNYRPTNYPLLKIARPFTKAQVRAAYRREAMKCHPDHGGTDSLMAALSAEREQALKWAPS
jgi:hypothetical protein